MTILTKHFNVKDYFDQRNAQSITILKFRYIKCVFGSTLDIIDSDRIDSDRIDSTRTDFERIDLCLDTIT